MHESVRSKDKKPYDNNLNNFATTESEILQMSLGLAGAGKQIGLTEAQVAGMATAMSSLGIASERGGSTMSKVMINMATAVESGGKELQEFANVAGMTSEKFAKAFKEDAAGAISAFIDGLGNASDKGRTAISILEEMGIKEVRLRDTLLRAGGASELFASAIGLASDAFVENTALQREFQTFSDTTASKIQIAKNRFSELAITAGSELLPSLVDFLEQGLNPVIGGIKNGIEWFQNLNEEQQQLVIKLGMVAVAGGPVLSFLSSLITVTGGVVSGGGKLLTFIGKLGLDLAKMNGLGNIAGNVTALGTASGTASGGVGLLSGAVGKLMGFALNPWVIGTTVAIGVATVAWQKWGKSAVQAQQDIQNFGTTVSKETRQALESFEGGIDKMSVALVDFKGNSDLAGQAVTDMVTTIKETADKELTETAETFAKFGPKVQEILKDSIDEKTNLFNGYKQQADEIQGQITAVFAKAQEERRTLTDQENAYVEQKTRELAEIMSKVTDETSEAQKKIFENLTIDVDKLSNEQLLKRRKALEEMAKDARKAGEEQLKALEDMFTRGEISYQEYVDGVKQATADTEEQLKRIAIAIFDTMQAHGQSSEYIKRLLAELGFSYEEIERASNNHRATVERNNALLAKSTANATKEVKEAGEAWNKLVLEDKEGKLRTNALEFLQEVADGEGGWEKLEFIMKHADISSNIKDEMSQIFIMNGKWYELDWRERQANVTSNVGTIASQWLEANGLWTNDITFEEKMAIINSNSTETLQQALMDAGIWETLTLEQKQMLMTTNSGLIMQEALNTAGIWGMLTYEQKDLILTSNIDQTTAQSIGFNDLWNNQAFVDQFLQIDTSAPDAEAKLLALVNQYLGLQQTTSGTIDVKTTTNAPDTDAKVEALKQTTATADAVIGRTNINARTSTNAPGTEAQVRSYYNYASSLSDTYQTHTTYLDTVHREFYGGANTGGGPYANMMLATGTPFHKGGLAILGDGKRKEPYLTPEGYFGVSPSTDTLYNLPRGTKVWPSISNFKRDIAYNPMLQQFLGMLPKFATGTPESFMNGGPRVPNVFKEQQTINSNPTLIVENFYAQSDIDVEMLFEKFKWFMKREGDRM